MQNFQFTVDTEYARKHNELLKDTKRLQIAAFIFALVQLALGYSLYSWLGGPMGIIIMAIFAIVAIIFLVLIPILPKKVGSAQELYDNYPLVPAVIAEVRPRDMTILALVNLSVDPSAKPRFGLATRNVTMLEGHERKVGEKVPSVAVAGRRSTRTQERWDEISPMPVAWGTPDHEIIASARKAIPHELWSKLQKNVDKLEDVKKTKFNLLEL